MKCFRVFSFVGLIALLAAGCTPIANIGDITGKSAMNVIYDATYRTVSGAWGVTGWIWSLTLAFSIAWFCYKILNGGGFKAGVFSVAAVFFAALFLTGFVVNAYSKSAATQVATHAVQVGADKAKTRKANQYVEKLHLAVTKTVLEKRTCNQFSNGGTGCRYEWTYEYNSHIEWDRCSRTVGSGNNETTEYYDCNPHEVHDTMHVPYFKEEWQTYAYVAMPDEYLLNKVGEDSGTGLVKSGVANNPIKKYTDWQAPENYDANWYGNDTMFGKTPDPIGAFEFSIPAEWHAMDDALRHGRPYIVTVYHSYVNWVFITGDTNNLVTTSSVVDKYLAGDLLPQVNMLYSRFNTPGLAQDYDFVQFKGGLSLTGAQDAAGTASLWVGPTLQGSKILWFVPAEEVDNPDAWIQAAKAYLSNKDKWGFNMAPKNMILIGCGVDRTSNMIKFCRMETGMPSGNVDLRYTVDHLHDIPFTIQGVFGTISASAVPDTNGFYATTVKVEADGIVGLLKDFKRTKMASLDWLKTDIKLDKTDIVWTVTTETASARNWAFGWDVAGVLAACLAAYLLFQMESAAPESPRRYYRY